MSYVRASGGRSQSQRKSKVRLDPKLMSEIGWNGHSLAGMSRQKTPEEFRAWRERLEEAGYHLR
jgi:hypothetical protein